MRNPAVLLVVASIFIIASCKNDTKTETPETVIIEEDVPIETDSVSKIPQGKALTEQERRQAGSVMAKLMMNPEFQVYTKMTISARLSELMSDAEGPYTLFVPEGPAFNNVSADTINSLVNPNNLDALVRFVQGHMVQGEFDSVYITEAIQKDGKLEMRSVAGGVLVMTKQGSGLVVTDSEGRKARISSTDLQASNGIIHGLDKPLWLN